MKCTYILLKNVVGIYVGMGLKSIEIDLHNDNIFNLVSGSNGSGKTSFINAIDPLCDAPIREGKKGYIELHYKDKKEKFIIKHFYEPTKKGHTAKKFITKIDKYGVEKELNPNGNITSYKELIDIHMGLTPATLKLLKLGSEMSTIITMSPTERKNFMTFFTNDTDIYMSYFKKINNDTNLINRLVKNFADKLDSLGKIDKVKENLDDINEQFKLISDQEIVIQSKITSLLKEIEDNQLSSEENNRLVEIRNKYEKNKKLKEQLLNEFGDSITKDISKLSDKRNEINNILDSKNTLDIVYNSTLNTYRINLDNIKEREYDLELELEKYDMDDIDDIEAEYNKYTDILKSNEDVYNKYKSLMDNLTINDFQSIINFFNKQESSLEAIYEQLDFDSIENFDPNVNYSSMYMNIMNKISILNSNLLSKEKEIKDVEEMLQGFSCNNMSCPLLKRFFSNGTDIEELSRQYNKIEDEIASLELQKVQAYGLHQLKLIYDNIISFISNTNSDICNYIKLDESFILHNIHSNKTILLDQKIYGLLNKYNAYTTYIDALNKMSNLESLKIQIDNRNRIEHELEKILKEKEDLYKNINNINDSIDKNNIEKERLKNSLDSLEYMIKHKVEFDSMYLLIEEYNNLYERIETCNNSNNALNILKDKLSNIIYTKNEISNTRDKLMYDLKQIKTITKQKKIYEENYKDIVVLRDALSTKKGIPLFFVKTYLKATKDIANRIMKKAFDTDLELSDFVIDEKEFRIPLVKGSNVNKDISKASSGERAIASLAISLALIEQTKCRYNILIFDELDGPLDKERRRKFLYLLEAQMKKLKIKQVFNISHNDLFNDYPLNLLLFKGANVSENTYDEKTVVFEY